MKKQYRIKHRGTGLPDDPEITRYRDFGRLMHSYQGMVEPLYRRPLYKDPKAFLVILVLVLLTLLIAEL